MSDDKPSIAEPSRYHRFKQNDGRGYGILRLDAMGSNQAEVVDADLTKEAAIERLTEYRRDEHDHRPSIAELQMMHGRGKFTDEAAIIDAAPVLLEIAAAALAVEETGRAYRDSGWLSEDNPLFKPHAAAHRAFNAALSKVRP